MDDAGLDPFPCPPASWKSAPPPPTALRRFNLAAVKWAERRMIDVPSTPREPPFWGVENRSRGGRSSTGCWLAFASLANAVGTGWKNPPGPLLWLPFRNEASAPALDGPLIHPRVSGDRRRGAPSRALGCQLPRALPPRRSSPRAPAPPPPGWELGADSLVCFCRSPRRGRSREDAWQAQGENRGRAPFASDGPS